VPSQPPHGSDRPVSGGGTDLERPVSGLAPEMDADQASESSPLADESAQQPEPGWRDRIRARGLGRKDAIFLGLATLWVVFDQVTKVAVRESLDRGEHWELASFYRFSHIANDGAAFGLFSGSGVWLALLPVIAIVSIALYYLFPPVDHWLTRLGLALILGGAIGNWLDRLYQGEVTDFINFIHFPAFNVADIGINVGIALILLYLLISDAKRSATHR